MFLYVEFADTWNAYMESSMGFNTTTSNRRIKKIKLTEEQIKELQPRKVGTSGDKDIYEVVSVLSIQED